MDLKEIMGQKVFAVVGDTLNEQKYAHKIKNELKEHDYKVYSVGKELESINDIPEDIDVIDLCIHPAKGIELLKECKKDYKCILIQPGAESEEILDYLDETHSPFLEGCALVGLRLYSKRK
ncbi:CoA-binding protein [Anaerotignum sp. MB30-C6]|uniref:CoA-binding protein n=1 Tax=Anaerotignum sp. MB30-C6 TaxID=3070814 RepID=UPI0027DDB010|nr:CoA-binding protein [Anaerotignum sp. MB30-C6]WMI79888.1 CoA-binding protein [Anaerotignum sp. MB30-C6]